MSSLVNSLSKIVSDASKANKKAKSKKKAKYSKNSKESHFSDTELNANGNIISFTGCSNIHIGNNIVFGTSNIKGSCSETMPETVPTKRQLTRDVEDTFTSIDEITESLCSAVCEKVTLHWRALGISLGISESSLEMYSSGTKEDIYMMLMEWKDNNSVKATVGWLCKSLWDVEEFDAAEFLAQLYHSS